MRTFCLQWQHATCRIAAQSQIAPSYHAMKVTSSDRRKSLLFDRIRAFVSYSLGTAAGLSRKLSVMTVVIRVWLTAVGLFFQIIGYVRGPEGDSHMASEGGKSMIGGQWIIEVSCFNFGRKSLSKSFLVNAATHNNPFYGILIRDCSA